MTKPYKHTPGSHFEQHVQREQGQPGERQRRTNGHDQTAVVMRRATEIKITPIDWLWPFHLARRKLHLISGAPGTGKTTVALNWLAVMSSGGQFPDGTEAPSGDVVIWSSEDSANDTIIPRLVAAGGDRSRIFIIEATRNPDGTTRSFNPATDMDRLALQLATVPHPIALLLDPVMATIKTGKDSNNSGDVRSGLDPVVQLAEQYDLAAIGITHFAKGTQGRAPIDRVLASVAFTAVPRMVFGCVEIADKPGTHRITKVKSNIAPTGGGFDYAMHQMIVREDGTAVPTQRIDWGNALEGSAAQLLAVEQPKDERQQRREDAKDWLREFLSDGPVLQKEIEAAARALGHTWRTIERAKGEIGVEAFREKIPGPWSWRLPEPPPHHHDPRDN